MNDVERMLHEQMIEERFQRIANDRFDVVDSLIEQKDLDKLKEEDEANACDD